MRAGYGSYAARMELSEVEIRVLGCLVEKQLTTPQAYPLTESALITACNQTTNRSPVVAYEQATVRRALLDLRREGLVKLVHRPGDRVEKHRHLLDEALGLTPAQIAVLSVLMLRGPLTAAELRTRTERLHAFATTAEVEEVLEQLADHDHDPLGERMARQPGQKEARFRHLLTEQLPSADATDGREQSQPSPSARPAPASAPQTSAPPEPARGAVEALQAEVADLRARVELLEALLQE